VVLRFCAGARKSLASICAAESDEGSDDRSARSRGLVRTIWRALPLLDSPCKQFAV
jgi:hypothetical protein